MIAITFLRGSLCSYARFTPRAKSSSVRHGTGSLTINAAPVPVSITAPGQTVRLTFDASAGQQVTVRFTNNTIGTAGSPPFFGLQRPNQTWQMYGTSGSSTYNTSPQTPAAAGTYTVWVDPYFANVGSVSVQVTSP